MGPRGALGVEVCACARAQRAVQHANGSCDESIDVNDHVCRFIASRAPRARDGAQGWRTALRGHASPGNAVRADRAGRCRFLNRAARTAPLGVPTRVVLLGVGTPRGSLRSMPPKSLTLGPDIQTIEPRGRGARSGLNCAPARARNALCSTPANRSLGRPRQRTRRGAVFRVNGSCDESIDGDGDAHD
jgi:hypothetical protein